MRLQWAAVDEEGVFRSTIEIPVAFHGSGKPERAWMLCDYPLILASLLRMGVRDEVTRRALRRLEELVDENGYRCRGSLPKFRGPGSKESICPYANLLAARALGAEEEAAGGEAARRAGEALLNHWAEGGGRKHFLFGIGTEYRKLKFPLVWYNLLHVLDVLSGLERFHGDRRLEEMAGELQGRAGERMRFTPQSAYQAYRGADFSDKKEPSPTVTLVALRILRRLGRLSGPAARLQPPATRRGQDPSFGR